MLFESAAHHLSQFCGLRFALCDLFNLWFNRDTSTMTIGQPRQTFQTSASMRAKLKKFSSASSFTFESAPRALIKRVS